MAAPSGRTPLDAAPTTAATRSPGSRRRPGSASDSPPLRPASLPDLHVVGVSVSRPREGPATPVPHVPTQAFLQPVIPSSGVYLEPQSPVGSGELGVAGPRKRPT